MKALLTFSVLTFLLIGASIMFREPEAKAQERRRDTVVDIGPSFDKRLDKVEAIVSREEKEAVKPRIIYKYKTRVVRIYEPVTSAVLVTDSAVYTVPAKVYDGVAVIDGVQLQQQIAQEDSSIVDAPLFVDTLIEEANHHISAWQQVKDFITKPFRKEKSK